MCLIPVLCVPIFDIFNQIGNDDMQITKNLIMKR